MIHDRWNVVLGYLVIVPCDFLDDVVGVQACFKDAWNIERVIVRIGCIVTDIAGEEDILVRQVDSPGNSFCILLEAISVPDESVYYTPSRLARCCPACQRILDATPLPRGNNLPHSQSLSTEPYPIRFQQ